MPKKTKKTTDVTVRVARKAPAKSARVIVSRAQAATRRSVRSRVPRPINNPLVESYLMTLSDPWECGPVKLGYDTFQDTLLGTGFRRFSFTVNADGSFSTYMNPSVVAMVAYNTAGAATAPSYTTLNASNLTGIQAIGIEGRVVSGGMRIMALFPQTSSPGVIYTGTSVSDTQNTFASATYTVNYLAGLPQSELTIGSKGSRGVMLPIDNDSYTFYSNPLFGYAASSYTFSPFIYFAGVGFPAGTIIFGEAILNIEVLPGGVNSTGNNLNELAASPTLADLFPSPTTLYNSIRAILPDAVSLDATAGLASAVAAVSGYSGLSRGITHARSMFGGGRHQRATVVDAGRSERQRARETTVVIEELQDDAVMIPSQPQRRHFPRL